MVNEKCLKMAKSGETDGSVMPTNAKMAKSGETDGIVMPTNAGGTGAIGGD